MSSHPDARTPDQDRQADPPYSPSYSSPSPGELAGHRLSVALLQPQIAPNTGNIARLCVATATGLHLVHPLGFLLTDKLIKRSGMDYWPRVRLTTHDDTAAFLSAMNPDRCWFFSSKGTTMHWDAKYQDGDCLVFGNETRGFGPEIHERFASRLVRIPQAPHERCLNLSTAAGIALYEALRQVQQ